MTVDEIIKALTLFDHHLPRQALAEAIEQRDAVVPYLLEALDYVYDHVEQPMKDSTPYELHLYAMFLLAQFREKRAFPKLIRILTLEKEQVDFVFRDTLTERAMLPFCSAPITGIYPS
ncbi:hypothetical protein AGMMS49942_08200 [Spirochaetia bacterium]|nr:hypothetical protein AGMMS49942_08200 [Spirochaetia bacterium]